MYANSGTGKDPYAYWTEDYVDWNRLCYDGFSKVQFDVSPEGTAISISTVSQHVYRISDRDSCYIVIEPNSLPEDPDAEFRAVHSHGNKQWILSDTWHYVFVSDDDGFTWEGRYVPTYSFNRIERASESYVMAGGRYYETDLPSIFLSRDLFASMDIYNLNIRASPVEMSIDSIGHIWLVMDLWNGDGVELHRTKDSFFPIVSSPEIETMPDRDSPRVEVRNDEIVVQSIATTVRVSVYSLSGKRVLGSMPLVPGGTIDFSDFNGTFMVVVQNKDGEVLCSQTVQVL